MPPLPHNPVFLFYADRFQRPNPFKADVAVDIGPVNDQKLAALEALESQFYEGGALGSAALVPADPAGRRDRRRRKTRDTLANRGRIAAE